MTRSPRRASGSRRPASSTCCPVGLTLLGVPKTKPVPISQWETICRGKGPQFAVHFHFVRSGARPGPTPIKFRFPTSTRSFCVPGTVSSPSSSQISSCRTVPTRVCPRLALKRQVEAAAENGYRFLRGHRARVHGNALRRERRTSEGIRRRSRSGSGRCGRGARPSATTSNSRSTRCLFVGDLIDHLEELGWDLRDTVAEGAYSQIELDFGYTDVLGMADSSHLPSRSC